MLKKYLLYGNVFMLLCCVGCATGGQAVRSMGYSNNTAVFGAMKEGKIKTNPNYPSQQWDGEYNHYFGEIKQYPGHYYQLVYHHPKDFTADLYSYYIALMRFPISTALGDVYAVYNGKNLPTAIYEQDNRFPFKDEYFVNILLTQEQLIEAYEGPGKLIISLHAAGQKYDVVFPDYYLRKVLAQTTNITAYKEAELLANPPTPPQQEKIEIPSEPITYYATFQDPYATIRKSYGQKKKISFDFKGDNIDIAVTYVYQYAQYTYQSEESGYVQSLSVNGTYYNPPARLKVKFENNYELKIGNYQINLFSAPQETHFGTTGKIKNLRIN